jgi:hypothetical protein
MGRAQAGETWPLNLHRVNDELDAAINDAAVRTVLRYASARAWQSMRSGTAAHAWDWT